MNNCFEMEKSGTSVNRKSHFDLKVLDGLKLLTVLPFVVRLCPRKIFLIGGHFQLIFLQIM